MVRVRNLEGAVVWTFPKGHLETGETAADAALREVWEETGWNCEILPYRSHRYFMKARYKFKRKNVPVRKAVTWFLMKPLRKTGKKDDSEILQTNWFSLKRAQEKISYPSDQQLLKKLCQQ
ncbi:MAG: NUDIX domain-containing protein [Elusimicrobia bacterium]|nr:NUDIX domain-containing protein [Elusimicrobiota bacterium]